MTRLWRVLRALAARLGFYTPTTPPPPVIVEPMPPAPPPQPAPAPQAKREVIYALAKASIGKHLTLDQSVPYELGCAEAVSKILKEAGYPIPAKGIQGVNALIDWMLAHGFREVPGSVTGCIITAHSPNPNNQRGAHCGIVMKFGICSNASANGHWLENYASPAAWVRTFPQSTTRYFVPL